MLKLGTEGVHFKMEGVGEYLPFEFDSYLKLVSATANSQGIVSHLTIIIRISHRENIWSCGSLIIDALSKLTSCCKLVSSNNISPTLIRGYC